MFKYVLLLLYTYLCVTHSAPLVTAPWGQIQGVDKTSPLGKNYFGYYGIPYAQPPIGDLRFEAPRPSQPITGVFNASQYGAVCIQPHPPRHVRESEDCLTLNVVVPDTNTPNRAVMVWIHGGGFAQGAARMYEPWKLVTEGDVIVVVIQYRLGVFGFFSTGSGVLSGNAALKDQTLALKWVKENIGSFGGNPNTVTVFGESAGGGSTSLLSLSPSSSGLFKRFIMQSGSATTFWADDRNVRDKFDRVVKGVGCENEETDLLKVKCVQNTPVDRIRPFTTINFGSSVDGEFMPDHPTKLIRNESYLSSIGFYELEGMAGVNNKEGGVLWMAARRQDASQNTTTFTQDLTSESYIDNVLIPMLVNGTLGRYDSLVAEVIKYEYMAPTEQTQREKLASVLQIYGDAAFIAPAVGVCRAHSARGKTFLYYFNHYPQLTAGTEVEGMYHGEDLRYLFGFYPRMSGVVLYEGMNQADIDLSDLFVKFISDFGKTGNPSPALQSKLGQAWKEFDLQDEFYLSFTTNMTLGQHLRSKRVSFWLDLIPDIMYRNKDTQTNKQNTDQSVCQLSRGSAGTDLAALTCLLSVGLSILCLNGVLK